MQVKKNIISKKIQEIEILPRNVFKTWIAVYFVIFDSVIKKNYKIILKSQTVYYIYITLDLIVTH